MYGATEATALQPSAYGAARPSSAPPPPPRSRHLRVAARAAAGLALSLALGALLLLAATTTHPLAGAAVALSNAWPGQVQYNTSFACVWHEPHWSHRFGSDLAIGHYECFDSRAAARNASAGRGFVYDVLGDDDDYVVPYRWDCAVVDDDEVYSEDSCGKADYTACWEADDEKATYCGNGSDCFDWCGGACENGWWSYCLWDVVAHAPEACNATFNPSPPSRRLRMGNGASCAQHSYCAPCGNENEYCDATYSYLRGTANDTKNSMQFAIEFLTPSTMESWCDAWGLPYQTRAQANVSAVATDHMPNVTDIKDVSKPVCPNGTSGTYCQPTR